MRSEYVPFLLAHRANSNFKERSSTDSNAIHYSSETLTRNYYAMVIAFSLNHGCVVTCLAYAAAILGDSLGSVYSGILYVVYAITSFLFAKPLVTIFGPQKSLFYGVVGYCIYVGGFLFAILFLDVFPELSWAVACTAAGIGGLAGGLLWTAQGRYFTQHCKLYSESTLIDIETVTSDFAAVFASFFLGIELFTKIIATLIYLIAEGTVGTIVIFLLFTILSALTCFIMGTIDDLDDQGRLNWTYESVGHDMVSSARLIYTDHRLPLLLPFQAAFGFASSFFPYYVFGTIVAESASLGTTWVGILSALVVLTGAIASRPSASAAIHFGKSVVISVGSMALIISCSLFFIFSNAQLGTWAGIIPLCMLFGVGRGIWENTNKAVFADFYAGDKDACTSAFAASSFASGYAAAMGYFVFPFIPRLGSAGLCVVFGILGLISYRVAFYVHQHIVQSKAIDKNALLKTQYRAYLEKEQRNHPSSPRPVPIHTDLNGNRYDRLSEL